MFLGTICKPRLQVLNKLWGIIQETQFRSHPKSDQRPGRRRMGENRIEVSEYRGIGEMGKSQDITPECRMRNAGGTTLSEYRFVEVSENFRKPESWDINLCKVCL